MAQVQVEGSSVTQSMKQSFVEAKAKCTQWTADHPKAWTAIKVALVVLAVLAALVGGGLIAAHFTIGIHGIPAWISQAAIPAIRNFMSQPMTIGQAFEYLVAPLVGLATIVGLLVFAVHSNKPKAGQDKREKQLDGLKKTNENNVENLRKQTQKKADLPQDIPPSAEQAFNEYAHAKYFGSRAHH
jgi:hypothetical protein